MKVFVARHSDSSSSFRVIRMIVWSYAQRSLSCAASSDEPTDCSCARVT